MPLPPELQFLVKELASSQQTERTVSALGCSSTDTQTSPHTPETLHTGPSAFVAPPAQRPDQDISSWTCSYHQKVWMKTELQSLGLWSGSHHMLKPGNALSFNNIL